LKRWGLLAGLLVAALAAGCRSDSQPTTRDEAVSEPTPGRTAKLAVSQHLFTAIMSDPKTFNPITSVDQASATVFGNLFDTLVRINPRTTEIEPALAEAWEYDADAIQYTFHLRTGVRWHDDHPFDADDVVFTFRAIQDPRVPNSLKHLLAVDGKPLDVEKLDDLTVRIRLPRPFAPLLSSLTTVPIIPEHILGSSLAAGDLVQQWGVDTPATRLIGTGPYLMTRAVAGQYIQYRRNPAYWMHDGNGGTLPYIEERTIRIVPNQDTMYLQFLAGESQIHNARPEEVPELRRRKEELGIRVKDIGLETGTLFVTFNRNPRHYETNGTKDPRLKWFTDKQFLRAVAHSIDREAIVTNCMNGFGRPAVSYISPENRLYHDDSLVPYDYDLDLARRLLAEGGYEDRNGDGVIEDRDGNDVEFSLNTNAGNKIRERICSILKEDWSKLGMKVDYRPLDFTVVVEKLQHTFDWDAVLIGFTGSLEPHNGANLLRSSGNLHLWSPNQSSPATDWEKEIDRLLEEGSGEMEVEKRRRIYFQIQEILHEELPMIQMVRQKRFVAYKNTLENFEPTAWGLYRPERIRFTQ